jgi:Ca-activated chloride channel family protein
MWGQVEGKAKIAIAKEVLTGLVRDLPDDAVVGLVAYGHRRKGDCKDVQELVPLSPIDKNKLIKTIQGLSPKGKTPISRSVRMTAERIKHLEDETTIILVSDGKETCDPDPCGLVKELKEAGIKFVMHVIGFDVTEEEKAQLECMAQAGGGEYFTAKNAKDFQLAAKAVVKKAAEKLPVSLKVTSIKDEKPFKTYVQILTQGVEKRVAEGWTSAEKPATFRLPPGMYDIRALDQSVIQRPTVDIKDVEIVEGQTIERVAVFVTEGVLHVKAIKNNAPIKAYVQVHRQEDNKYMRDGWTREDGTPAEYKLLPGLYKISVQDPSVIQRPVIRIENVEVKPGQSIERVATFGQGGILHVKAIKNNAPAKTYVKVFRQEDNKYMRDGWTREDGTPAEYKLLPGLYKIWLQDQSVKQRPEIWIENVEVKADQTVERFATFVAGGVFKVTATKDGAPYKAYVKVYSKEDDKYMGDGWARADGKAAEFKLLPGVYSVKVEDRTDRTVREIRDIQVQSGKTTTVNAPFP